VTILFVRGVNYQTPVVSDVAPDSPLSENLWVDTSVDPPVLKVYDSGLGWISVGASGSGATFGGVAYTDVIAGTNIAFSDNGDGTVTLNVSSGTATIADGVYGDITVSGGGAVWTVTNARPRPAEIVAFPATSTSPGEQGQIAFDATTGQIAICVSTNVWRYLVTAGAAL